MKSKDLPSLFVPLAHGASLLALCAILVCRADSIWATNEGIVTGQIVGGTSQEVTGATIVLVQFKLGAEGKPAGIPIQTVVSDAEGHFIFHQVPIDLKAVYKLGARLSGQLVVSEPFAFAEGTLEVKVDIPASKPALPVSLPPAGPEQEIQGEVAKIDAGQITIKSRSGELVSVQMPDKVEVTRLKKSNISEVVKGKFVGVVGGDDTQDDKTVALEVVLLPGFALDGIDPWRLSPDIEMRNGELDSRDEGKNGVELTLTTYFAKGQDSADFVVPRDVPVAALVKADRSELLPGEPVLVIAAKLANGTLLVRRIRIGADIVLLPDVQSKSGG